MVPTVRKKKARTLSMPQLSYAKLTYRPHFNKREVAQKIGDVKATVIEHNSFNHYTYQQESAAAMDLASSNRKFSFSFNNNNNNNNSDFQSLTNYNKYNNNNNSNYHYGHTQRQSQQDQQQQHNSFSNSIDSGPSSASSSLTSSTLTSIEDLQCDDKDGHYIINPGSLFANDRYQIQSLLGQGTFGKVIKAYDRYQDDIVAIKIIRAIPKYREASKIELRVLSMLKKHDPKNENQCIHLRECFDFRDHVCIVTDILSISLFDFLEKNQFLPFPGTHIQAIAKQLLRSVAFMHDLKLIHTDLKPENVLLKDASYVKKPYTLPCSTSTSSSSSSSSFSSSLSNNKKANRGKSKTYYRKILTDPKIYTIDFGSAIFQDEYHSTIVSTRHYRAPEIILGIGWSYPCDMWSLGCILVELITGDALFKTHENVQHLAMMEKVLGERVDLSLVRKCFSLFYHDNTMQSCGSFGGRRRSSGAAGGGNGGGNGNGGVAKDCIALSFSKKNGHLIFPTPTTPQKLVNEVQALSNLADLIGSKVGFKFTLSLSLHDSIKFFKIPKRLHEEYTFWFWFLDLVKCLLVYDPEKRLTAKEAMGHKWFDCGLADDGIDL
ncbi:unnamed protein product [Ambrosiozyma monospora]|uniref:Unnamed protein product n=1 Tax=Ambrosiozyma monospora TaxID=43982 RepID=A0A9W7DK75_AMBMO|nr:unnamed protein product [Ambrosiozyma monospora]